MPRKKYSWADGVTLEDHTAKKLSVLKSYFHQYLRVKCTPLNRKFRIAIVDGFAGGGVYECGTDGSPLIFLKELALFADEEAISRKEKNLPELEMIECLFIVNDIDEEANIMLDNLFTQWLIENKEKNRKLNVTIIRKYERFDEIYFDIKELLLKLSFHNVLFNLDPCGYTHVKLLTIQDIIGSFKSAEVFYTFMIGSLFNYSSWSNPDKTNELVQSFCSSQEIFFKDENFRRKDEWLGAVEKIVYHEFARSAKFVSPFAINKSNKIGYNYWLMHFANSHRAREVYNNVLYQNTGDQAHYGKSGLQMLGYSATDEGVQKFDWGDGLRAANIDSLQKDLPKIISQFGDALDIQTLKASIYNETTSHSDDIRSVLINHTDIEVITTSGGKRRSATAISDDDTVRLNEQRPLFHILPKTNKKMK